MKQKLERGPNSLLVQVLRLCGRRQWHPTPILLPGKSHGQRSLVGCSPWGRKESDTFPFHFPALEKDMATHCRVLAWRIPGTRDGGAWWAAVYGVAQSWTRLKQLSSSSSSSMYTGKVERDGGGERGEGGGTGEPGGLLSMG